MFCYTHPNQQAVGICKNCNKGVCPLCAIELEDGIACSEHCAGNIKIINSMITTNRVMQGRAKATYYRGAFIYGAMSCLFWISGFVYPGMQMYMFISGGIFALAAVLMLLGNSKLKPK